VLAFALVPLATGGAEAGRERPLQSLLELRREHVVVQQWDLSCGAAALTTLLNVQHGDPVSEREVARRLMRREEYIANPDLVRMGNGFSLLDLKRYVEGRGYVGRGYGKLNRDDLIELAPLIVPINTLGYDHFVVFRGIARDRVLLADPAWGNRTMPWVKFEDAWIDYPEVGRVGFTVEGRAGPAPAGGLRPQPRDFVIWR
jgi:predicted double-glycine peptidase